jgi:hypothetical protein
MGLLYTVYQFCGQAILSEIHETRPNSKKFSPSIITTLNLLTLSIKDMIDELQSKRFRESANTEDSLDLHFSITNNTNNFSGLEDL